MFATMLLGCLIFIDDYFNCLTVGSVMLPVSDKARVSRAKLAYLIDTTAAPICIIAPIFSWAAAVSGFVEGENGMKLFVETIPYNYYALLSICMMLFLIFLQVDFGPMAVHERNAVKGDLFTTLERPYGTEEENKGNEETFLCNRNALFRRILLRYRFCDRFFSIGCADRSRTGVFFRFALYTRVLFYTAFHFFYRSNGVFTGML